MNDVGVDPDRVLDDRWHESYSCLSRKYSDIAKQHKSADDTPLVLSAAREIPH